MGKVKSLLGRKFILIGEEEIYTIKVYNSNGYVIDQFGNEHDIHCVDDRSKGSFAFKGYELLPEDKEPTENSDYSIF